MEVAADFVCEHQMPQPWVTCIDCMSLPPEERPQLRVERPPKPPAAKKSVVRKPRAKRTSSALPAGKLPRSESDPVPDLVGDKDLAYEIPPEDLSYFVRGSESDWLPISTMPRELRSGGFVYLQCGSDLVARARVAGIGFRERRWDHAPPSTATDLGPGATIELDGGWVSVVIDLGADGEAAVDGYRYLIEHADGVVRVAPSDN